MCPVLATKFKKKRKLRKMFLVAGTDHRSKPHSLEPRPCEECGRVYSNLSNLRQHMKLIHFPRYVACNFCSKSFKTDLYLRRHMLSCHEAKPMTMNYNTSAYSSTNISNIKSERYNKDMTSTSTTTTMTMASLNH